MPSSPFETLPVTRHELSATLVDIAASPRAVVEADSHYTDHLVAGPYAGETKASAIGRKLLTKVGLYDPNAPGKPENTWQASSDEHAAEIHDELEQSREAIRQTAVDGVNDVVVDQYIGLRDKESILPQFFRDLHSQSEKEQGRDMTFLDWMANHATDSQLLNVWQWHDEYLRKADADPVFVEKVAAVKEGYVRGLDGAISKGELHPDMRVGSSDMDEIQIVHASPLSPNTATTIAHAHPETKRVLVTNHFDGKDAVLYHEVTHLAKPGLVNMVNEAATDRIAARIYDSEHPDEPGFYEVADSPYSPQDDVLKSIEAMSGGKINTFELSRLYAGENAIKNTLALSDELEKVNGLPLIEQTITFIYNNSAHLLKSTNGTMVAHAQQNKLRDIMSLFEGAFASGVARISSREDFRHFTKQLFVTGVSNTRYSETLFDGLEVLKACYDEMEHTKF